MLSLSLSLSVSFIFLAPTEILKLHYLGIDGTGSTEDYHGGIATNGVFADSHHSKLERRAPRSRLRGSIQLHLHGLQPEASTRASISPNSIPRRRRGAHLRGHLYSSFGHGHVAFEIR